MEYRTEIRAPAEVVWNIMLNFEGIPRFCRTCDSIEVVYPYRSVDPVEPGLKFHVTLNLGKRKDSMAGTFTRLEECCKADGTRVRLFSYTASMFMSTGSSTQKLEDFGGSTCRLSISYGLVPMDAAFPYRIEWYPMDA